MDPKHPLLSGEHAGFARDDLRQQVAAALLQRIQPITADTVSVFPYSSDDHRLDERYCRRLGELLVQLLAVGVRDGQLESHGSLIADLHRMMLERGVAIGRLFTFAYLTERTAVDDLALTDALGATTEPWPAVAQLLRRASFDMLGAYAERVQMEPAEAAILDKLTTLYTRLMFDAVLAKELERAGRFGLPLSLILCDVDHLSAINKEHGYGVGDRILERLGILLRTYFRGHDWVARYAEDSTVVLLTRTDADNAAELAEGARLAVEDRLGFTDHRSEKAVRVSVSAAVVNVAVTAGDVIDPERLLSDAEHTLDRAKQLGRNRVERADVRYPYSSS